MLLAGLIPGLLAIGLVALLVWQSAPSSVEPAAPQRGYTSRACGFDLDDDGIIGERDDDCRIGDGETLDPDGDGVDEDIFYVSCQTGSDAPGTTGAADDPFRTISHAYTKLDGPGDGAEDIIAFRGVCSEQLSPTVGGVRVVAGVPAVRVKQPTGSEQWPFEFPTNPAMLIGWDFDKDGDYPPHDQDDIAVLHGNPDAVIDGDGLGRLMELDASNSFTEFAHFTVDSYGRDRSIDKGGVLKPKDSTHVYVHDLSLLNINRDRGLWSGSITFNMFSTQGLKYFAVINVESLDNGGYFTREGADSDQPSDVGVEGEFLRFQNISYTAHGCDLGDCASRTQVGVTVSKIWGFTRNIEWLDNEWDANHANWSTAPSGGPAGASSLTPAQCTQDWVIRNNEFTDFRESLLVQASSSGSCTAFPRPVKNIVFDANIVRNSFAWNDHIMVDIRGGAKTPPQVAEDITISNNVFTSSQVISAFVRILTADSGNKATGHLTIVGNTMSAPLNGSKAAIAVENNSTSEVESFDVRNNIITGIGSNQTVFKAKFVPSDWTSDFNVIDPNGSFRWGSNGAPNLGAWRTLSGGDDANSRACVPSFVNANAGDFHLDGTPGCALDNGVNVASISAIDFERDVRPQGSGWDIGADEFGAGADADGDGFSDDDEVRLGTDPFSAPSCPVNLNDSPDGAVTLVDFVAFSASWQTQLGDVKYLPQADFIESNSIDLFDFTVFGGRFGTTCGQ